MTGRSIVSILITAICAAGQCQIESAAQAAPDSTQTRRFELSASAVGKAQLSRSEIDPLATGMNSIAARTPIPAPSRLEATAPMTAPNRTSVNRQPQGLTGKINQNDNTDSYLQEYNVDWSSWIGSLADRWFFVLRGAERETGMQFTTQRPALIQFTCYADGTIGNIMLRQTSGVSLYDRLQIEALMSVVPTARFPAGTKRSSITLCQGWESHQKRNGESDFQPGSFGRDFPAERVRQWVAGR